MLLAEALEQIIGRLIEFFRWGCKGAIGINAQHHGLGCNLGDAFASNCASHGKALLRRREGQGSVANSNALPTEHADGWNANS